MQSVASLAARLGLVTQPGHPADPPSKTLKSRLQQLLQGPRGAGLAVAACIVVMFCMDSFMDSPAGVSALASAAGVSAQFEWRSLLEVGMLLPLFAGIYIGQLTSSNRRKEESAARKAKATAAKVAAHAGEGMRSNERAQDNMPVDQGVPRQAYWQERLQNLRPPQLHSPGSVATGEAPTLAPKKGPQSIKLVQAIRSGDLSGAEQQIVALEKSGVEVEGMGYSLLVQACVWKGELARVWRLLDRLEARDGQDLTAPAFNAIIDACAKKGDPSAAEEVLRRMELCGVKPNVVSYTSVIYAYARLSNRKCAEEWFQRMREAGLTPNVVTYDALIVSCVKANNMSQIEEYLRQMEQDGVKATVTTYTTCLDACAKAGDLQLAEKWYERMVSSGVKPNEVTLTVMINACAKVGDVARAEQWVSHMHALNLPLTTRTFTALMKTHITAGDTGKAEDLLGEMENGKVKPIVHNYSTVICAYAREGRLEKMLEVLARMEAMGVVGDSTVYSAAVQACARANQSEYAADVLHRMMEAGVEPHIRTFEIVAKAHSRNGDFQACENLIAAVKSYRKTMSSNLLASALLAYAFAENKQPQKAEALFLKGTAAGVQTSEQVFWALCKAIGYTRAQQLCA